MKKLEGLLTELEQNIPHMHCMAPLVSASPIGWHIEHCLLTLNLVADKVKESDPEGYKPKFHFWKMVILGLQRIPKKKVKAPKVVQPKDGYTFESLFTHVAKTRQNIASLENLPKNAHFYHPFLGIMNMAQTTRFLNIHTKHHLSIINEIIKSVKPGSIPN